MKNIKCLGLILTGVPLVMFLVGIGCENSPTDQGPLWTKYWTVVYESKQTLHQIQFVGPDEAWIVGGYSIVHYINGNFNTVNIPPSIYSTPGYEFIRASFSDQNHGWLIGVGTILGGSAVIYRYIDGVWEEIPPLGNPNAPFYYDVKALSSNSVWVVGDNIWHFDGVNWNAVISMEGLIPKRLYFQNENDGYLTVEVGMIAGGVLHWDGNTWMFVFSSNEIQPRAIAFDNQGNGFMVTWSVGGIYSVDDWQPIESSQYFAAFTDIASNSSGDIWAVGQSTLSTPCNVLAHWNGISWHYERTIPTTEFHSLFVKEDGEVWSTVHTDETSSIAVLNIN